MYLVAPRHPDSFWSMQGTAELFGAKTLMPNSALATLVALTPPELTVEYLLGDENVGTIDWDTPCDLVAVTGNTIHADRINDICRRFRNIGRTVALGGTYASTSSETCEALADHLFVGEAEHTWPAFLRDWSAGRPKHRYVQEGYIDLQDSPPPDWSLIRPADYLNISIQTTRGCPNRCDFCDVIRYLGRKCRTKSVDQVMTEIRNAHALGAHSIFFSDDNFLGDRRFTRKLLGSLVEWNTRQTRPLSFSTQITVQVADDESILKLMADARFSVLFLGVETVRKESLQEVHKSHNLARDLKVRIRRVSRYGIVPFIGLMVGFDSDDADVFDELHGFLRETDSPVAGISLLNAPKGTPLYKRLANEGRLANEDFAGEWHLKTNVIPLQMTTEELYRRYWDLYRKVYDPPTFTRRLQGWLAHVEYSSDLYHRKQMRHQIPIMLKLVSNFLRLDGEMRKVFLNNVVGAWRINPRLIRRALVLLSQYRHFRDFIQRNCPATTDVN